MKKKTASKKRDPKQDEAKPQARRVDFEFFDPSAKRVCLAGSFNDWQPEVTEMVRFGEGKWVKDLLLQPGTHEYRFIVDGIWTDDPNNPCRVPNSFGSFNCVLQVKAD